MDFETWFKQHVPGAPEGAYHELLAVWEAATMIERERCAKLVIDATAWCGGHGEPSCPGGRELAGMIRGT